MIFRKPELIPLLFMIGATIMLCSLGGWQVKRMLWKEALITQVQTVQALPPLTSLPGSPQLEKLKFRYITLTGKFLHDREMHKTSRYRGKQVGYHVLTPFQPENKPQTILVNRGWVPTGLKEREKRPETLPKGIVPITGLLMAPQAKNIFLPDNDVKNNVWLYDDMTQMSGVAGQELYPLMFVVTGDPRVEILPMPSDGKIKLRNDHMGYVITWFLLAIIGLIMFAFYCRVPDTPEEPQA